MVEGYGDTALPACENVNRIVLVTRLVVEKLIGSNASELCDLLVDVMDIVLHCVDHNHLKAKPLSEVFAPICIFPQVSHCPQARRIAVGTK